MTVEVFKVDAEQPDDGEADRVRMPRRAGREDTAWRVVEKRCHNEASRRTAMEVRDDDQMREAVDVL